MMWSKTRLHLLWPSALDAVQSFFWEVPILPALVTICTVVSCKPCHLLLGVLQVWHACTHLIFPVWAEVHQVIAFSTERICFKGFLYGLQLITQGCHVHAASRMRDFLSSGYAAKLLSSCQDQHACAIIACPMCLGRKRRQAAAPITIW